MTYSLWQSFKYASKGIKVVFKTERNFRIQCAIAILVILFGLYRQLGKTDWLVLLITIALVLSLEIMNSSVERLVDILAPRTHNFAKDIKDLLAAMVFLASFFAFIIGLIIFLK